jgi:hypothetical protein
MRDARKRTLHPFRRRIKKVVRRSLRNATAQGNARTWFVPILVETLAVFLDLQRITFRRRRLSRVLGKRPREVLYALLKVSRRDRKTRSRWAAALANAVASGISPGDLAEWLRKGGGVSGRAKAPSPQATTAQGPRTLVRSN